MISVRWWKQAVRTSGRERSVLVQAGKGAIAAVIAWLVAAVWLRLPQPFLAPYTAVFLLESTVYRSAKSAAQQLGAVALGVVLAALAAQLITVQLVAIAVVVLVGLLVGHWRGFGSSGTWVGVTALLLITYGTAGHQNLLVDRLLETVIGGVIGLAVNALVVPPLYLRGPADATKALAEQLSALLRGMAGELREEQGASPGGGRDWTARANEAAEFARAADEATREGTESLRMNLRKRTWDADGSAQRWRYCLVVLNSAWPHVRAFAEGMTAALAPHAPFRYPTPPARKLLAELLEASGDLVEARADERGTHSRLRECADRGHELLDELERLVHATPAGAVDLAAGLGGLLLPARRAFEQLRP
jgi:hypothetical protein